MNATADGRPTSIGFAASDLMGAQYGAFGVLAALYHRKRTGEGQHVNVNLLSGTVAALAEPAVHFLNTGEPPRRKTPAHACPYQAQPYGVYRTKDSYLAISGRHLGSRLSKALGIPDLEKDPRFDTFLNRYKNHDELERLIEEALGRKTTAEWMPIMEAEDVWAAPVNNFPEVFADPQVLHNNMVVTVESPIGPLRLLGIPYKLSKTPARVRTAPPTLGQHTDEVLRSMGYTREEVELARQEHAI